MSPCKAMFIVMIAVLSASACAKNDQHVDGGLKDGARERGAPDRFDGLAKSDSRMSSIDGHVLGLCGVWSNWKQQTVTSSTCDYLCQDYRLKCSIDPKGSPTCDCSTQSSHGSYGGGAVRFCPGVPLADPAECLKAFTAGCCDSLASE